MEDSRDPQNPIVRESNTFMGMNTVMYGYCYWHHTGKSPIVTQIQLFRKSNQPMTGGAACCFSKEATCWLYYSFSISMSLGLE